MKQFVLKIAAHSATLKTEPTGSKDTGIFFPPDLIEFLGGMENLSFTIYKDDCISAMASIIASLPLYSNKSGKKISHTSISDTHHSYMKSINEFFGNNATAVYNGFQPSETTQARRYLYGLDKGNFSIRKFLVADYSTLTFIVEDDGRIFLRIKTNVVTSHQSELPTEDAVTDIAETAIEKDNSYDLSIKQHIFFGAPGTGKSNKIDNDLFIDANGNPLHSGLRNIDREFKFRTTFHPDYDYAQFVGSYKPVETPNIPILNEDDLSRELRRFLAEECPNAIHKFAACYFNSLKKLTTEEKRELFNNQNVPETVLSAEIPKGMAAGEYINGKMNASSISYSFVPQIFAKAYVKAWIEYIKALNAPSETKAQNVYLVIEEINRGNCAQIFGDIFQLLDRTEGHSDYPINIDADFARYIENQLSNVKQADGTTVNYWNDYKDKIQEWDCSEQGVRHDDDDSCKIALPPNFNILATMNTSDQSLFPMDSAFKRRFDWEYVPIDYAHPNADFDIDVGDKKYKWLDFLKAVNANVCKVTRSEDKQMGEFFIKHSVDYEEFRSKILFYLWDSVYKDEEGTEHADKVFHFKLEGEQDKTLTFQALFEGNDNTQKERIVKIMSNLSVVDQNAPRPQQGEQEANAAQEVQEPAAEENAEDAQ